MCLFITSVAVIELMVYLKHQSNETGLKKRDHFRDNNILP